MLIDNTMEQELELAVETLPAQPVVTLRATRSAANEDRFEKTERNARRQRRQRRFERTQLRGINGWTVRTW